MTHKTKDCVERPRAVGAKWDGKRIAADEKVEDVRLETYDARRDRWNGYDASEYGRVVDMCVSLGRVCVCACVVRGSERGGRRARSTHTCARRRRPPTRPFTHTRTHARTPGMTRSRP